MGVPGLLLAQKKMSSKWSFCKNGGGFGAFTFCAHQHGTEECDARGLPLTPNSIIMTGNFQELKNISHPNLCKYLDLIKCASEGNTLLVREFSSVQHSTVWFLRVEPSLPVTISVVTTVGNLIFLFQKE